MSEITFTMDNFSIYDENGLVTEERLVLCEIDLVMTEAGEPASMPSMNDPGEPGWGPEFEIHEVRLIATVPQFSEEPVLQTLILNESDFITFFVGAQDVVNNSFEWAAEQEPDFRDDDDLEFE